MTPTPTAPDEIVDRLRATFRTGVTRPFRWRREQLLGISHLLDQEEDRITAALEADLGKSPIEAYITDVAVTASAVEHILKHLDDWAKPERVKVPITQKPGQAEVVYEPLGVVAVLGPWNYPVQLLVMPMAYALAAGNTVLAKPSELAPATSALLAELIPQYLDSGAVAVVEGGPDVAKAVLAQRFDHIFFTGSEHIARSVMAAAVANLTPLTLELGGKSPCYVDESANLTVAARRIVLGRFLNAGQTCVAPDYVLVHESVEDRLVPLLAATVKDFFGPDPRDSGDFARIVNERHVTRLQGLLTSGGYDEVVTGGEVDVTDRYVAPTVLRGVSPDSAVMADEIFGPILPVLSVPSADAAIAFINDRPKPLALYVFADDDLVVDRFIEETSSGGVCANHTLVHLAVPDLPFGGVGASGFGAYHGKAGFETFSHRKSVLRRASKPDPSVLYPPYGRWKARMIRTAL